MTGDELQGTMGRVQTARTSKERRLGTSMYHAKVFLKRFHFNGHIAGFHP